MATQIFLNLPVKDPRRPVDSREAVDEPVRAALASGGSVSEDPQDVGFMYSHSFQDPDGHRWEVAWMGSAAMPAGSGAGSDSAGGQS